MTTYPVNNKLVHRQTCVGDRLWLMTNELTSRDGCTTIKPCQVTTKVLRNVAGQQRHEQDTRSSDHRVNQLSP
jgi:hypothetical protein